MREIFEKIYHQHIWFDQESRSGPGSTLAQTKTVREIITSLIDDYSITSILDIPCGDFNWMKEVNLTGCIYYGRDIVRDITFINQHRYGSDDRIFECSDITSSLLPTVDLVFCRDCLVHFSDHDIVKAIANIKESKSKLLLTTTFSGRSNFDIPTGSWRPLNLQNAPFNLSIPILLLPENCTEINGAYTDKSLALWSIESLPDLSL